MANTQRLISGDIKNIFSSPRLRIKKVINGKIVT